MPGRYLFSGILFTGRYRGSEESFIDFRVLKMKVSGKGI